ACRAGDESRRGCQAANASRYKPKRYKPKRYKPKSVTDPRALQAQECLCVAVRDPFAVTLADRKLLQECPRLSHRSVGVINREHDPRDADLEQQVEERCCEIEAAESIVHVLTQIGAKGTRELRHLLRQVLVESRQHERNAFAQVANNDLQFRIAIEHASEHHANEVDAGFDVPAPACARKHRGYGWRKPTERSLDDCLRRHGWMQIDRDAERFGALQNRREELVIQIATARVAVDQSTFEALLPDSAVELLGRFVRRGDGQCCKGGEPRRIFLHRLCEKIVRFDSDRYLIRRFGLLDAGRIERKHLHVDAGRIHAGDALFADILELLVNPYAVRPSVAELFGEIFACTRKETRTDEVLFKRDGSHCRSVWYFACAAPRISALLTYTVPSRRRRECRVLQALRSCAPRLSCQTRSRRRQPRRPTTRDCWAMSATRRSLCGLSRRSQAGPAISPSQLTSWAAQYQRPRYATAYKQARSSRPA